MKKSFVILVAVFALLLCFAGCNTNNQEAAIPPESLYVLSAEAALPEDTLLSLQSGISRGQDFTYTVSNYSYVPVAFRQVLLLSVYDAMGAPLALDGSSYTASSIEILCEDAAIQKTLSQHQAVYVSEYSMDEAQTQDTAFTLQLLEEGYKNSILRLDLILLGKPQQYPYADWELLDICSTTFSADGKTKVAETVAAGNPVLPNFAENSSYQWDLYGSSALLQGIGSLRDSQIFIPATVYLSKAGKHYIEDPIYGTSYDVTVASNAFYGCKDLQTVTFADGVSIEQNTMHGMFQNCSALTAVSNIPDSVVSMENTFYGCRSLKTTPQFPASLQDMTNCFWGCSALEEVQTLPGGLKCMESSFRECTSLTATPVLPEGVEDLSQCFYKCDALRQINALPDSVTDMTGCFSFCTGIQQIDTLPASLRQLNYCFQGCTSLSNVSAIPEGAEDITGAFYNCAALTQVPALPDSIVNMSDAFQNCTGITQLTHWPASLQNLSGCFLGCTNLESIPVIPTSLMNTVCIQDRLDQAFWDCDALASVQLGCCKNAVDPSCVSNSAKITFATKHTTSTTCTGCNCVSGTFDANGIKFRVSELPQPIFDFLKTFLETEVPDSLKKTCRKITFSTTWSRAHSVGYATYPTGLVYIDFHEVDLEHLMQLVKAWRFDPSNPAQVAEVSAVMAESWFSVIYHELGHCYDTNFSTYHRFSNSSEFKKLYEEEYDIWCGTFRHYQPHEYSREVFARSTTFYFMDPEYLLKNAPGIYAYLDNLYGEDEAA